MLDQEKFTRDEMCLRFQVLQNKTHERSIVDLSAGPGWQTDLLFSRDLLIQLSINYRSSIVRVALRVNFSGMLQIQRSENYKIILTTQMAIFCNHLLYSRGKIV